MLKRGNSFEGWTRRVLLTNVRGGDCGTMTMFDTSQAAPAAAAIPPYSTAEMRSYPLGTLVYRAGLMPLETVNRALAEAADSGRRLGEVLLEYGLPERELARLLAAQHGQEFVDLGAYPIDHEVAHLLPRPVAEMYCAIPLKVEGEFTIVAVPDADNASHLTRLREALHGPIRLVTAARSDIKDAIEQGHARQRLHAARRGGSGFRGSEGDRHARHRRGGGRWHRRRRRRDDRRPPGRLGRRARAKHVNATQDPFRRGHAEAAQEIGISRTHGQGPRVLSAT